MIAIHECLFMKKEDHFSFEVAQAIATGVKLNERVQPIQKEEQYVPTAAEWKEWFQDHPEWLELSEQLLLSCNVEIKNERTYMPKFPLPEGVSAEDVLYEYGDCRAERIDYKQTCQTKYIWIECVTS